MSRTDLEFIQKWAASKMASCGDQVETPYLVLRNSVDSIIAKMDSSILPSDPGLENSTVEKSSSFRWWLFKKNSGWRHKKWIARASSTTSVVPK